MDKNTVTGFVLIGAVLIGFTYFSQPSKEEQEAWAKQQKEMQAKAQQEKKKQQERAALAQQAEQAALTDSTKCFFAHRGGEGELVYLKNNKVKVGINTKGGTVSFVELEGKYKDQQGKQVKLLTPETSEMSLSLDGKNENFVSTDYIWQPVEQTDKSLTLQLTAADGGKLLVDYTLRDDSYMLDFNVRATDMGKHLGSTSDKLYILWTDSCRAQEKGYDFENRYAVLQWKEKGDDTDDLGLSGTSEEEPEEALDWVAFKNQFFSVALIGHEDFTKAKLHSQALTKESGYLKYYKARMQTKFDPTGKEATHMQMYLGPNDFHLLQDHNKLSSSSKDLELEEMVDLGWPLLKWINRWFILNIFDWLTGWGLSMGLVLLIMTLIIKAVVYPATKKSYMSSARMRVLKPKMEELSKKYPNKEDAMKKQQEMMGIYQQYGVSPMGGCLPMLIQMPIFIAMFNFVPRAIQLRGESFLWANDLSAYDELINWGVDLPLIGDHLSIFCVLFCATNIINTMISMKQQSNQMSAEQEQQMKMMKWMMYLMPVMFFFMFNNYSSGLSYYYFLSGLLSILIMWFLRKSTNDAKLLAELEAYREKHKNDPKKMNSMAQRLEALQKQQEMMRQMQNKK